MYSNEMIKKLYRVSLAALVIGLGTAAISPAQALLPAGSPKAVRECLEFILPSLAHGLEILKGTVGNCAVEH